MKRILYISALFVTGFMFACSSEDNDTVPFNGDKEELEVSAEIKDNNATRVLLNGDGTNGYWEQDDKISITGNGFYNVWYTTNNSGVTFPTTSVTFKHHSGGPIYYSNPSNTKVLYEAFYPTQTKHGVVGGYMPAGTLTNALTVSTINQAYKDDWDFLWDSCSTDNKYLPLRFKHKMSMITFKFVCGTGCKAVDTLTYTLNKALYTTGQFDVNPSSPRVGNCYYTSNATGLIQGEVKTTGGATVSCDSIIIFPQNAPSLASLPTTSPYYYNLTVYDSKGIDYHAHVDLRTIIANIPGMIGDTIKPGKRYILEVKVSRTPIVVQNATIEDWDAHFAGAINVK